MDNTDCRTRAFKNSACMLSNVGFDPILGRKSIIIIQSWITHYTRRTSFPYGYNYRNIYLSISSSIAAFKDMNEEDINKYMVKYWYDFLTYGVNRIYPDELNVGYSDIISVEPQWQNKEDVEVALGAVGLNLQPISPYS